MTEKLTYEDLLKRIRELEKALAELKAEDETRKKNEAYFRTLVRTMPDLVWMKDEKGVYLSCNSRFERLYGAKEEEIVGKTDYDFVDKDLADFFRGHDKKAIEIGSPSKNEEEVIYADDGHREILETTKTPVFREDGQVLGVLGIGRDITDYKRAEEERQSYLDFLKNLDRINRAIQVSDDIIDMTGKILDEVITIFKCDRASLLHPRDLEASEWDVAVERTMPEYPGVVEMGKKIPVTPTVKKHTINLLKSEVPVELTVETGLNLDEEPFKTFKIKSILSITLRPDIGGPWELYIHQCSHARIWNENEKKLFAEVGRRISDGLTRFLFFRDLKKSEGFLENIVDNIPNMVFVKDADELRFVLFNKEGERLLGYGREELLGKNDYDLFPTEIADFFTGKDREVLGNKTLVDIPEEKVTNRKGEVLILHTKKIPILDEKGRPKFLLGISENITDRIRAEKEISETKERLQLFMNSATDSMSIYDENLILIEINDKVLSYLPPGTKKEDMIGKHMLDIMSPYGREKVFQTYKKVLETGEPLYTENVFGKGDDRVWINIRAFRVGKGLGVITSNLTAQRKAEKKNREARERLQLFMNSSTDSMSIYDENLRLVDFNDTAMSVLPEGTERKDLVGRHISEFLSFFNNREHLKNFEKVLKTGKPYITEDTFELGDKKLILYFRAFKVGDGIGILNTDVTAQRQVEEQNREIKERLQLFMNSATDMMAIYDADFRLIDINERTMSFFPEGVEKKDLLGKYLADFMPFFKEKELFENYEKVVLTGTPYSVEDVFEFEDKKFAVLMRVFKVGDGIGILTTDITAQRQAEEKNRETQERMKLFMDSATDSISLYDSEFNLIDTNTATLRYFPEGVRKEDMLGVNITVSAAYFGSDKAVPAFRKVLETGEPEIYEEALTFNSKKYWFNTRIFKVGDGIGVILNDFTERKKLEEQLLQAQKIESIGRLAGGVAHDFNNMLGIIMGYTDIALNKTAPDEKLTSYLKAIMKAAERSADLTHQLLAFARKQTVSPRVLDLNETLAGMLKMLHTLIGENIELEWKPADTLWSVQVDPSQVDQILANLCVNARDAITDTGRIVIETGNISLDEQYCSYHPDCVPGDFVVLSVSDNGRGMDSETRENIFEPFFTTKGFGKGTGLGLATVHGIVKQNSGHVNVYSEPGVGTTFKIFLPRHEAGAGEGKQEQHDMDIEGGDETILLVEDEVSILEMTQLMLERMGYNVLTASKSEEALLKAGEYEGSIDMLLSDVIMPDMNGKVLAEHLLKQHGDIRCLFMSGYTDDVIAHHGVLDEGVHFIQKPFSSRTLAAKVRQVLDE